ELAVRTLHIQDTRAHAEVLANRLGVSQSIEDADGPVLPALNKITVAEEEERHPVARGGLAVADKLQDMGDRYLVLAILVNAAALEAARTLDDPQVFSQVAVAQVDTELLRPECKKRVEVI